MGRKGFVLMLFMILAGILADAQDVIYTSNGEEIQCLVVDISPSVVKYRKFQQEQGPVYSIAIDQVEKIKYQSGKAITFKKAKVQPRSEKEISSAERPAKPPNTFGWHFGLGSSIIDGDIEGSQWQMASTLGASFNLALGGQNSLMFGADILSVGCGLEDLYSFEPETNAQIDITEWEQNMGYLNIAAMYRQYFNAGRNYFAEGGLYGSFLLNAEWQGLITITDTLGQVYEENFRDDLRDFYDAFDYGLSFGLGGRIPVDKKGKWHISLEARFYYGLANIINQDFIIDDYRESNMFGLFNVGVDIPTSSD